MTRNHPLFLLLAVTLSMTAFACDDGTTNSSGGDTLDAFEETLQTCGGATCSASQTCCDGACVDVSRDALHCGACNTACESGFACDAGVCALSCQEGLTDCDGVCRDLSSDDDHCGTCGATCPVGTTCDAGVCACAVGFGDCNDDASDGCETSLLSDAEHCGVCGDACTADGADGVCEQGSCTFTCVESRGDCDEDMSNGCETDVAFSNAHCGACGETCSVGVCQFGECYAAQRLALGEAHTCAIQGSGRVYCWGSNTEGQLGVDEPADFSRSPVPVPNFNDAIQVVAGEQHSCALNSSGSVICWGANGSGQLGDATLVGRSLPVEVIADGFGPAIQISAGRQHTCALEADGEIWCWGENADGRVGDGTKESRSAPERVVNLGAGGAVQMSAGGSNTCAVLTDGTVQCWGDNFLGQLIDGTDTDRDEPVAIVGLSDIAQIHVGGAFMCAVHESTGVQCWGNNPRGQIGSGSTSNFVTRVEDVSGLEDTRVINLDAGGSHTCAVVEAGTAKCWGSHEPFGELGTTDPSITLDSNVPVDVDDLTDVIEIATGSDHSCAMLRDQTIYCWGRNDDGQLGTGLASGGERPTEVRFTP